jgi:hypothetical protein
VVREESAVTSGAMDSGGVSAIARSSVAKAASISSGWARWSTGSPIPRQQIGNFVPTDAEHFGDPVGRVGEAREWGGIPLAAHPTNLPRALVRNTTRRRSVPALTHLTDPEPFSETPSRNGASTEFSESIGNVSDPSDEVS